MRVLDHAIALRPFEKEARRAQTLARVHRLRAKRRATKAATFESTDKV